MTSLLSGCVSLEIISADMTNLLAKLNTKGIHLYRLSFIDMLTASMEISKNDLPAFQKIVSDCGATVKIKGRSGLYWILAAVLARPILVFGICLHLLFALWLPTRILFISVEGNTTIPDQVVIEQANRCGIVFGASRQAVRSEKMKNNLLSAIPSLQWAGINTRGCTAVISVKERSETQEKTRSRGICSIVAAKDGVIASCTALRGELKCKVGQAVKKGDTLISGYTDLGLCVKAVNAAGEIYAQTKNEISVLSPLEFQYKGQAHSGKKKYGLLIGKKRIFFNKGSGISGVGCDRIYSEYCMTLPGGYRLPVALFVSFTTEYSSTVLHDEEAAQAAGEQTARGYLLSRMISGQILHENVVCQRLGDVYRLFGQYICNEMIGRVQHEGIHGIYGENN